VGRSVVVWTDTRSSLDSDIKAQLFDSLGRKVGAEITIATGREKQHSPSVAMDSRGNFVVAWTMDFSSTDKDVWAARFDSAGRRIGSPFAVAKYYKSEYDPDVAMASNGEFVISYTYQFSSSDTDVFVKKYSASGTLVRTIDVASTASAEGQASVAAAPDGRFSVAYVYQNDVYLQRYDRYGNRQATLKVANTTRTEHAPDVALDKLNNAVVAFHVGIGTNVNVQARTITASNQMGAYLNVAATSLVEGNPSVAINPVNRNFIVAYQANSGTTTYVRATEMTSTGRLIRNYTVATGLNSPSVTVGVNSVFLIAAHSRVRRGADPDGGVFGRLGKL
jgi:hypothetical protein